MHGSEKPQTNGVFTRARIVRILALSCLFAALIVLVLWWLASPDPDAGIIILLGVKP